MAGGVSVEVVKNFNAGHDDHESCTKVTTSPTIPSCFCRGHCDQSAKNSVRNKLTTKNIFFHAEDTKEQQTMQMSRRVLQSRRALCAAVVGLVTSPLKGYAKLTGISGSVTQISILNLLFYILRLMRTSNGTHQVPM